METEYPRTLLFSRGAEIVYRGVRGMVVLPVYRGDPVAVVSLKCMRGTADVRTELLVRVA